MFKSLNVFGAAVLFVLVSFSLAFAQATTEQLVVTTYFPSPAGSFRELRAQRMAIGDNYYDTAAYCWSGVGCTNDVEDTADLIVQGRVGINTWTPGYILTVNGQPAANGYTLWTDYSDKRLKENIKGVEDGTLEKIMKLKPSSFDYNELYYKLTGYTKEGYKLRGFIAQEIQEVFPEMVNKQKLGDKEYLDTNLTNLQVYLVKAIQEQQKEIEKQQTEIKSQQAQIDALKLQMDQLRSK